MNTSTKKGKGLGEYMPLAFAAGIGSMLGSGIIVGLSATIVVWQEGLGLDTTQVGLLSGILTFAIAFGSLFGGRLADKIGRVLFFNWINLFYAIGAAICVFAPNFTVLLIGLIIAGLASGADLPVPGFRHAGCHRWSCGVRHPRSIRCDRMAVATAFSDLPPLP